jgi:hypothetical protein
MSIAQSALAKFSSTVLEREKQEWRRGDRRRLTQDYFLDEVEDVYPYHHLNDLFTQVGPNQPQHAVNEQLAERLASLQLERENAVQEALELLNEKNRKTSYELRERSMLLILHYVLRRENLDVLDEQFLANMEEIVFRPKSQLEMLIALNLFIITVIEHISSSADAYMGGYFERKVNRVAEQLRDSIDPECPLDTPIKSNLVTGYAILQFVLIYGSRHGEEDGYDIVLSLMNMVDTLQETQVIFHVLQAVALIISAMSYPNDLIEELLPRLTILLESSSLDISSGAGIVIALCFQTYNYGDESKPPSKYNPMVEQIPLDYGELLTYLKDVSADLRRRVGNRDIVRQRGLFNDIRNTIGLFSTSSSRNELGREDLVLSHLNGTTMSHVDSWSTLLLLKAFRWLLGPATAEYFDQNQFLHTALRDSFYLLPVDYQNAIFGNFGQSQNDPAERHARDVQRTKHNRRERQIKQFQTVET